MKRIYIVSRIHDSTNDIVVQNEIGFIMSSRCSERVGPMNQRKSSERSLDFDRTDRESPRYPLVNQSFNGGLMEVEWDFIGFYGIYPLVMSNSLGK